MKGFIKEGFSACLRSLAACVRKAHGSEIKSLTQPPQEKGKRQNVLHHLGAEMSPR
jgi:hypothetical protein